MVTGVIAAILTALALATGTTVVLTSSTSPDKNVNLTDVSDPQPWANAVGYDGR